MPALIIQSGKNSGKKLVLPEDQDVVIGRDETCQIRLPSAAVSRQHCVLRSSNGEISVRDLGSQNGTIVNGVPIESEVSLQPGDLISVGPMVFQVAGRKLATNTVTEPSAERREITDDSIADWLSDDDSVDVQSPLDSTTIIPRDAVTQPEVVDAEKTPPPQPLPKARSFRTVADEGADIIRRYLESLQDE